MPIDVNKLAIYRIIPISNLEDNIQNGLYCKNQCPKNSNFATLGNNAIIEQRNRTIVKCYPDTVVNDDVPFYFSVRTPMLYNIITAHNVPSTPQENIVYLCFKLTELTTETYKWCYTNGNAAKTLTKFYNSLDGIESNIDWHSIETTDFRDANADGDEDRIRKKHSEFLIKGHVPSDLIKAIVVLNNNKKIEVETILEKMGKDLEVKVNPNGKYYF